MGSLDVALHPVGSAQLLVALQTLQARSSASCQAAEEVG